MASAGDHEHRPGMHDRTLESLVAIGAAASVELEVFGPDGDLLALVEIPPWEAERLVALDPCAGHRFETRPGNEGRVIVGPVLADTVDQPGAGTPEF
ncbi:MAG: hypothetical protein KF791_20440 [Verrucomicrobiae bacterium]|nr:hypothetical protein [Verrucomicrobiae bacterium]